MENVPGYGEAVQTKNKYLSQRAKALRSLQAYVTGTQYEGRPNWFSEAHKVPMWERAPCIVYPIVKCAIDSNSDLLLGEGRFPVTTVEGLSGDEADEFEKTIARIEQQARFRAVCRETFASGQGCGSACGIFLLRGGRLAIDTVRADWCELEFDPEGAVVSLEIKYPYLKIKQTADGPKVVCMLYRRTIDKTHDILYNPAEGRPDGLAPKWTIASELAHGFGFCPVVWYPHMQECSTVEDFDGRAIHEHLTDEIQAHDFALSQRHRAALYAGDPQWTEIGVQPGYNPTEDGRVANVPSSRAARPGETSFNSYVSESSPPAGKARKKSPGTVWQYAGDASKIKVELHTLPGDALKALDDHARDLRSKLSEALGIVFLDADSLPNESRISGRALESFKARQLDRVDYYRSDFGDRFMAPALGMLLRIALVKKLQIEGLDVVRRVVERTPQWSWHAPPFHFVWGDYFKPSGEEEFLLMQAAEKATLAGIATKRILVEKLRSVLGIRDVDAYMKELEAEQEQAKAEEKEMMKHEASLQPKPAAKPAPKGK